MVDISQGMPQSHLAPIDGETILFKLQVQKDDTCVNYALTVPVVYDLNPLF